MAAAAILFAVAQCVSTTLVPNVPALTAFSNGSQRASAAAAADFNGDGVVDLAVTGNDVLLLGTASGRFFARPLATTFPARFAIAADVNGDGKPDLITAGDRTISVRLGRGDGTFDAERLLTLNDSMTAIATVDFDGDHKTDLLVAGAGGITRLRGNGDGTFTPLTTMPIAAYRSDIVAGDFDGDGKVDLAAASWIDANVVVARGNGDGTFTVVQRTAFGFDPALSIRMTAADFDGDGKLDLAIATGDGLHLLLGNGDATFRMGPLVPLDWNGTWGAPQGLAVADVDGDGKPDVLAVESFAVAQFLNRGGSFAAPTIYRFVNPAIPYVIKSLPLSVVPADIDGDGRTDLIEVDALGFASVMMSGCASGTILRASSPESIVAGEPLTLTVSDANGASPVTADFRDNGITIGSGAGTITTTLQTVGRHLLTATSFGVTTAPLAIAVHAHPSAITIADTKPSTTFGEPIVLQGSVTSDGAAATFGDVQFANVGTAPVINGHYETNFTLPPGTYDLVARYTGAAQWPRSDATPTVRHEVTVAPTSIGISSLDVSRMCEAKFPPQLNGRWGFLAKVDSPFSVPAGVVTLRIPDLGVIDAQELFEGVASFGFGRVRGGSYPFTLTYAGGNGYAGSELTGTLAIPTCHGHAASR